MAAVFACIVQPKVIEFNVTDQKAHRAQKDEELLSELKALTLPAAAAAAGAGAGQPEGPGGDGDGDVVVQPGGGCRVLVRDGSLTVASVGSAFCVFEGSLSNSASLAEQHVPLPEDEPSPAAEALSPAQLVCHLYSVVGVEMLGLLRGSFTFVLYESKTSRVLAARDGGGHCPLLQARTPRDSLVLSNSRELLEGASCHDLLEFLPGDYKYGWSAIPRRYQPADHARLSRRSLDLAASSAHHHHNNNHHHGHHGPAQGPAGGGGGGRGGGSRRSSLDNGAPACGNNGNRSRRASLDHQATSATTPAAGQAPAGQGKGPANGSPNHPHPHRTYVVSADDPRIIKAAPGRGQQHTAGPAAPATGGEAAAASAVPVAGGGVAVPTASQPMAIPARAAGGADGWRGSSARGGNQHHQQFRPRSVDNHGSWRLGAGQAMGGGAQQRGKGAAPGTGTGTGGEQQPQPQQAPKSPNHQYGKHEGKHEGNGRRRSGAGREGRPGSLDGWSPAKGQQSGQQPSQQPKAAAGTAAPAAAVAATAAAPAAAPAPAPVLRVDAPAFTPHWAASAPAAVAAVGSSP